MHHPTDRITHTTAFVTPVVEHWLEREIAQWVHPMKDRSDDPSHHERTLLPRSYLSLPPDVEVQRYWGVERNATHHNINTAMTHLCCGGARCSSVVRAFAHGAMGRRIDPSWVNPLSYFSFQPVLHDWCNKGRGMCYPVCG